MFGGESVDDSRLRCRSGLERRDSARVPHPDLRPGPSDVEIVEQIDEQSQAPEALVARGQPHDQALENRQLLVGTRLVARLGFPGLDKIETRVREVRL